MREYVVNRPDAGAMRTLLERESDPEGVIVRLAWLAGLSRDEIAALCWEQVSFMDERLELPDRTIPMTEQLRGYLWRLYQNRKSESPYVVVSERYGDRMQPESISRLARQALDRSGQKDVRLMDLRHDWIIHQLETEDWPTVARLTRAALIRGGLEHVHLMDLRRDERRQSGDTALLERAAHGAVSRGEAMELLGLSRTAAYARLRRLTEEHRLIRIGGKYYLPGTVVPPEEQPTAVQNYLEQAGFAYRQEIARLLHVQPKQCTLILKRMVTSGQIAKQGQKYLPQEQKVE